MRNLADLYNINQKNLSIVTFGKLTEIKKCKRYPLQNYVNKKQRYLMLLEKYLEPETIINLDNVIAVDQIAT